MAPVHDRALSPKEMIEREVRMPGKLMFAISCLIAISVIADGQHLARGKFAVNTGSIYSSARAKGGPDVLWLSKYGNISWEAEKAHLDNFAIQLMNEPNLIGYYYVMAGKESCRGEAQARAVRAKTYMTKVRGADWDRIIWRDIGYGDVFHVSIWLADRGKKPMYVPDYQRATEEHVIKNCRVNPGLRRGRSSHENSD